MAAALTLTSALVAACADRPAAPEPELTAPPGTGLAVLHRLPPIYDALYYRPEEQSVIRRAETALTTACMAKRGYTFSSAQEPAAGDEPVLGPRPFGVEEPGDVWDGQDELPPEPVVPDAAGYGRALNGDSKQRVQIKGAWTTILVPASGCRAEAEQRLLGGDDRLNQKTARVLLYEAERKSLERLDTDREYQELVQAWQTCMHAAGVDATDPAELPAAENKAENEDQAREKKKAEAQQKAGDPVEADLKCKKSTDFLRRAYLRMALLQREVLAGQPGLMDTWTGLWRRQVAAANDHVAGA